MVDILLYAKPRRWIGKGAHANNYTICFDPCEKKAEQDVAAANPAGAWRGRSYNPVKIVHDPLGEGAFKPGAEFSGLDKDMMLECGAFTVGTSLIIDGALHYVHGGNGRGQCVKKHK